MNEFFSYEPSLKGIKKCIHVRSKQHIDRQGLADVIEKQYAQANIKPAKPVKSNIGKLRNSNTFTVTSGHQLCIFTGPLFFVYKILQTIKLAREIQRTFPEYDIVPVFWLASEDHDYEEINHVNLFGNTYKCDFAKGGSVGDFNCQSIFHLIESELNNSFRHYPHGKELLNLIKNAYKQKKLSWATRYLVDGLFGKEGLLIIDANEPHFKKMFSHVIKEEIISSVTVNSLQNILSKIKGKYKPQAAPLPVNLFYMTKGNRLKIIRRDNKFIVGKLTFTEDELLYKVNNEPELFSPNVILRPLYQEVLLPNVAFVGGSSEIAYWLLLKPLFDHFSVNFPLLIPRNSVLIVKKEIDRELSKKGLKMESVLKNKQEIIKTYLFKKYAAEITMKEEKDMLNTIYDKMLKKAVGIDKNFEYSVNGERTKAIQSVEKLEKKMMKHFRNHHTHEINELLECVQQLFPEKKQQERVENFMPYYLKYGQDFFDEIYQNINPFVPQLSVVVEK